MSIRLERQRGDFWCWAAVAQAIDRYFNSRSPRTQCQIAGMLFPSRRCCARPPSCDEPQSLRDALREVGHLREFVESRVPFATVADEIDQHLVIGARIGWPGGGHFVIISGYSVNSRNEPQLEILDPWEDEPIQPFIVSYERFALAYQSYGEWTHSYLIQA